jgi:beta-glucosidase
VPAPTPDPGTEAPPFVVGLTTTALGALGAHPASDWAGWERAGRVAPSGQGNGGLTRWRDDAELLAGAGVRHVRVVVDWARIHPTGALPHPGALEEERDRVATLVAAGVTPWVALHHVAEPGWFVDEGGLLDDRTRSRHWPRFVDEVGQAVGDLVGGWFPVVDPVGWAANAYLRGTAPPGRRDPETFAKAVRASWFAWRDAWRELRGPRPVVTAVQLGPVRAADETAGARDRARSWDDLTWGSLVAALRDGLVRVPGLAELEVPDLRDACDAVGVIYRGGTELPAAGAPGDWPRDQRQPWVEGFADTLHRLAEMLPDRPIVVAEHGVGTDDDDWRAELLRATADQLRTLRHDGVPVTGYFHRSAIDGYEPVVATSWGLFDRDRNPRQSLAAFTELAAALARTR